MDESKPDDGALPGLTADEALIVFEWLSTREEAGSLAAIAEGEPELRALRGLLCMLESTLVEPFQPDYAELVEAARRRLVE